MALVPFSVSGAAGSQDVEERLMQVGPYSLLLRQRPGASGNTAHLQGSGAAGQGLRTREASTAASDGQDQQQQQQQQQQPDLSQVGLVLWQSGYVLADFLLLRLQAAGGAAGSNQGAGTAGGSGSWAGVRVLELGCGGGTVGMFLALAGAQVVLTDQEHILPLTQENLALNFPATAAAGDASSQDKASSHSSSFGRQTQQPDGQRSGLASAASGAAPADASCAQQPLSAAAAFAAAFGAPGSAQAAAGAGGDTQSLQGAGADHSWPQHRALDRAVFGPGPLVVSYGWGEPLRLLQGRVAAAAAARLSQQAPGSPAAAAAPVSQPQGAELQATGSEAPAAAVAPPAAAGGLDGPVAAAGSGNGAASAQSLQRLAAQGYDVVVGADLLYDMTHHAALLDSLQQVAAASPHVQVNLCWRCRSLGEDAFLEAAAAAGWVVEEAPVSVLHPEFQTGYYKLVRMVHLP